MVHMKRLCRAYLQVQNEQKGTENRFTNRGVYQRGQRFQRILPCGLRVQYKLMAKHIVDYSHGP